MGNLDMLERWGNKAWIAHSYTVRGCERVLTEETAALRAKREDVNKKRKLDQVSCGNELRRLALELEQYQRDNAEVEQALHGISEQVFRLKEAAKERNVKIHDLTGETSTEPESKAAKTDTDKEVARL